MQTKFNGSKVRVKWKIQMLLSKITMNFSNQKLCLESFKMSKGVKFKWFWSSAVTAEHCWRHLKLRYLETISIGIVKARGSEVISAQFASVWPHQKQRDFFSKKCAFTDSDTWAKLLKKHIFSTNARSRSINQTQSACGDHLCARPFKRLQSKTNFPSRYIYLQEN